MSAVIDTPESALQNGGVELSVIEQLLIIRRRRDLTVAKAARRWRLNARTMRSWEQGIRAPRPATVNRLKRIIFDEEMKGFAEKGGAK